MFSTGYVAVASCIDILLLSRDCRHPIVRESLQPLRPREWYILLIHEQFSSLSLNIILYNTHADGIS